MTLGAVTAFDASVAAAVHGLRGDTLTTFVRVVTASAGTVAIVCALLVLCVVLVRARRAPEAGLALSLVAGGMLLSTLVKVLVGRVRPPVASALIGLPESASLPSGHTMASLCLAVALSHAVLSSGASRAAKAATVAAFAAWAVTVGVSRIYLGVHWPSDVAASWVLGGGWVVVVLGAGSWRVRKSAGA